MLQHRLPLKRLLLLWGISAVIALVCVIGLLFSIPADRDAPPHPVEHDMRAELLCRIPSTADTVLPESLASARPHLRIKETASGRYELHYWGNPIRPKYAYSIRRLSDNTSLLRSAQGTPWQWLPLPVTVPRREDKQLPHQPGVLIPSIPGPVGTYFAARISIHDAATGMILCTEVYLLHGTN